MLLIVLTIFVLTVTYLFLIRQCSYWSNKGVVQYNGPSALLKIFRELLQTSSATVEMEKTYREFTGKRYCGDYQFARPVLYVREPDLIKQLAIKDFDHFTDHHQIISAENEPLWGKNLLALKGDEWRDMRATLSPSFTGSKMKIMFGLMCECAERFVKFFEEQKDKPIVTEMKDTFTRFTNDVIASAAFGFNCNSLKDRENQFYSMGKEVTNFMGFFRILRVLIIFMFPNLSKLFGIRFMSKSSTNYFTKIIKDNVEIREKKGIIRPDMIHLLMEAHKKDIHTNGGRKLSTDDIVAQALIFFFAGFETVSTLMCFAAYELAVDVDIQKRLRDEVHETLRECNGNLTYEALMKMKYMDMVISESLRKWPAALASERVCVKPYTIEATEDDETNVLLKKGDMIWFPTFALHRDPQYYPNPERFDPERFNDENRSNINPYTYMPFGVGPRSCIGNRFALMETKILFFYILSKFDIVVVDKTQVPLKLAKSPFQLTSENGFWLGLKHRKPNL